MHLVDAYRLQGPLADAVQKGGHAMEGLITTRHLLTHSTVIVREFGVRCYLRCLGRTMFGGRKVTFLECIRD
jgi:hypothetical protein